MFHRMFVFVLLLNLVFWNATGAGEPFKNETATTAQKNYESAIEKAKKEYLAQLEIAIKEAGAAGDLEEANRIATERDEIRGSDETEADDPVERLRKRLEGSHWGPNPRQTIKLHPKRKVIFSAGYPGTWILADEETLILQSSKSANLEIWKFNENKRSAQVYSFTRFNKDKDLVYKKYR